jgi:DNA-binding CsgD family transcriptional regulator
MVVDDAQWADVASLSWLVYLARRLEGLGIALVFGVRAGEPGVQAEFLSRVLSLPGTKSLRLGPLSQRATAMLVESELGPAEPEFCGACHSCSGGNPFMLRELIAALRTDGVPTTALAAKYVRELAPETVSRAMMLRLSRLPKEARELVEAVAVLGVEVEVRHAADLASLERDVAERLSDELRARAILKQQRSLEFVHPIVRQSIYAQLPEGARGIAHSRAAHMLAEEHGQAERVAMHLLSSEPAAEDWAVGALRHAARVACSRGAPEMAVAYLSRALSEPPRAELRGSLLAELGHTEVLAGGGGGIGHLEAALDACEEPQQRVAIAMSLASALFTAMEIVKAVETLERAVLELDGHYRELGLRIEAELASLAQLVPTTAQLASRRLTKRACGITGKTLEERLLLASFAYQIAHGGGTAGRTARVAEQSLGGGLLISEAPVDSLAVLKGLYALGVSECLESADEYSQQALIRTRQEGSVAGFVRVTSFRAWLALWRGDVARGEADARGAQSVADFHDGGAWVPHNVAYVIDALVALGELDAATSELERRELLGELPEAWMFNWLLHSRGCLRLASGQIQAGLDDLLELATRQLKWGNKADVILPWRAHAAAAYVALGKRDNARQLADADLVAAKKWGTPRAVGVALRGSGLATGGEAGISLLRQSADELRNSPAALEHIETLLQLGAALRRGNQRSEARVPLREAMDLAERCGAAGYVQRARRELHATGARPRRHVLSGADALTASERRVAELAAEGLANRQIAQALFLTINTIETHLTHAYQKLGISSRQGLREALMTKHPGVS